MIKYRTSSVLKKQNGFTLMEILIAIAIIGVIFSLVASFFKVSTSVLNEGHRQTEEQHAVRLASDVIAREVRNALSVEVQDNTDGALTDDTDLYLYIDEMKLIKFNKDDPGLTRAITVDDLDPDNGVAFQIVRETNNKYFLQYTVTSDKKGDDEPYSITTRILLNNIDHETVFGEQEVFKKYLRYTKP